MQIGETLRFIVKVIFPLILAVNVIFFVVISIFPFSLSLTDFTLIYWGLSIVAFPLNYQAQRWTEYVIKNYGPQVEKNPIVRRMYIKGDLKLYWIAWICMYIFLFTCYALAVYTSNLVFLISPLLVIVIVLVDFLNDFYWLRKLKTNPEI
jgi:hypothetical protein